MKTIAIIFGGANYEHRESIKATRLLYKYIDKLFDTYHFKFYYLTKKNKWATEDYSNMMINEQFSKVCNYINDYHHHKYNNKRMLDLKNTDLIYNTMMGQIGEDGSIMGLANIINVPIIGCGILASSVSLDKHLSKILVSTLGINTTKSLLVDKREKINDVISNVHRKINYPCFVKPTNLGTSYFVFRANNENELRKKFSHALKHNQRSDKYLIEEYIDNTEVRIFIYQDKFNRIVTNDLYTTQLNLSYLDDHKGSLFHKLDNNFQSRLRRKIKKYATQIFHLKQIKDLCSIFFCRKRYK